MSIGNGVNLQPAYYGIKGAVDFGWNLLKDPVIETVRIEVAEVVASGQVGGDDGAFYFPYILDPQATTRLIVGTCRVWRGGPATSSSGTYSALFSGWN